MNTYCYGYIDLQLLRKDDIVSMYLLHGKGGHNACDGQISHSRGGSKGTEGVDGYYMEAYQAEEARCLQGRRRVSDSLRGLAEVSRYQQNRQRREQVTTLAISLPATPRMLHTSYHAVSSIPMLTLPVCILHTPRQERQESRRVLL